MVLGSIQPLTEMSKGGRCVRLTTNPHPVPLLRNLGTLTSLVMGLLYFYLYIYIYIYTHTHTHTHTSDVSKSVIRFGTL